MTNEEVLTTEEIKEMVDMFKEIKESKSKSINKRKRDQAKVKNKKKIAKKSKRRNR